MTTWSDVFDRTEFGPAVFAVTPTHRRTVLGWAEAQDVPAVSNRDLYAPAVDGWAVLDGGITSVHPHSSTTPATTLPPGVRVVGFQALRLLVCELDLVRPPRPFPGEAWADVAELRRRHRSPDARLPSAVEKAELLASCVDGPSLRWVAATLLAESRALHR
ncbi:hypothetical protein [Pseudonocardia asaccharolytica]|uniref:Uncharacterized protein n=1 Tax=Pseudonocardia asaccharolytica DSM 44247 = NBRC 16224 TaxID=1123024 RepID=A0A511D8Z8_9PSEU|nr:hypothetical protein [Pseudonocardia asaccharolytica]GEL20124.1 hypothetical protein PA7_39610 [Pseudonocardia asaccharolytica DSM 44247 = NBRC 16224]